MKKKKIKGAAIILSMMVAVNLLGKPQEEVYQLEKGITLTSSIFIVEVKEVSRAKQLSYYGIDKFPKGEFLVLKMHAKNTSDSERALLNDTWKLVLVDSDGIEIEEPFLGGLGDGWDGAMYFSYIPFGVTKKVAMYWDVEKGEQYYLYAYAGSTRYILTVPQ